MNAPLDNNVPADNTAPVNGAVPADNNVPVAATAPVGNAAPVEAAAPVQSPAPVESAAPAEAVAPTENPAPVEAVAPVEDIKPSSSHMSPAIIFIGLIVLAVLGYFGYTYFLAPMMNPYAALMPAGLEKHVQGANADAFIVYKKDLELEEQLKNLPTELLVGNSVQSAVVVLQGESQSVAAYVEFTSEDEATLAKSFMESNLEDVSEPITLDLRENVLVVGVGLGEQVFSGSLLDNPNISRIDAERLTDQFILYVNNTNIPELNQMLPEIPNLLGMTIPLDSENVVIIETAHAQSDFLDTSDLETFDSVSVEDSSSTGFLQPSDGPDTFSEESSSSLGPEIMSNFLKDTVIYIRLKEGVLSSKIVFNILPKDELSNTVLADFVKEGSDDEDSNNDIEGIYDASLEQFAASIPDLNRGAGLVKMIAPSVDVDIRLEDLVFIIEAESPLKDLVELVEEQNVVEGMFEGPKRAQDAGKKMDINILLTAAEVYKVDNGKNPEDSICVDQLDELAPFVMNEELPIDEQGAQTFGDIECAGGYYYQYFPDRGSIFWAKMELSSGGNMTLSPAEFKEKVEEGEEVEVGTEGEYYAVGDGLFPSEYSGFEPTESAKDVPTKDLEASPENKTRIKVKSS